MAEEGGGEPAGANDAGEGNLYENIVRNSDSSSPRPAPKKSAAPNPKVAFVVLTVFTVILAVFYLTTGGGMHDTHQCDSEATGIPCEHEGNTLGDGTQGNAYAQIQQPTNNTTVSGVSHIVAYFKDCDCGGYPTLYVDGSLHGSFLLSDELPDITVEGQSMNGYTYELDTAELSNGQHVLKGVGKKDYHIHEITIIVDN